MTDAQLNAQLAALGQRIAALESAPPPRRPAGGQASVLRIDPSTGKIQAAFPGGVIAPEQTSLSGGLGQGFSFTPDHGNGINGVIAALLAAYVGAGEHTLQIGSYSDSNDQAFITLNTTEGGAAGSAVANLQVQDQSGASHVFELGTSAGLSSFLQTINNLSDVNPATARANLGLGAAALEALTFWLQTANNLSDVPSPATAVDNLQALDQNENLGELTNKATARVNLGLGSAALLNTNQVAETANNLSDIPNPVTALKNLGIAYGATNLVWTASQTATANTINHGLGSAPTAIFLGILGITPAVLYTLAASGVTASQFTIEGFRSVSGTVNLSVCWVALQ